MFRFAVGVLLLSVCLTLFPLAKEEYFTGQYVPATRCRLHLVPNNDLSFDPTYYYDKIIKREFDDDFGCVQNELLPIVLNQVEEFKKEQYEIVVEKERIILSFSTYSGYVYALESLSQLIDKDQVPVGRINDEPIVAHRGIMIDSVRHFLSVNSIKRTISAMPASKLNKLHWHLSDDEAFTFETPSHPELYLEGSYTSKQRYSLEQIKDILNHAKLNAVNVIPEIDTPGHVRGWGLSKKWKAQNITILCPKGQGYNHQMDLSKEIVYDLVQDVLKDVEATFKDADFIHLGGDEVFAACWDQVPAIQTFMKLHHIGSYGELQMYWRKELKSVMGKKAGFWKNRADNVTTGPEDILHYWGNQNETASFVKDCESQVVLSPSDYLYINKGQGFIWGNTFGTYITWKNIYQNFTVFPSGVDRAKVLGAEILLWGEVSNEETLDNNMWMRASAFAQRVWTEQKAHLADLVQRLVALSKVLNKMGVQTSPLVSEFCEWHPEKCFK